MTTSKKCERMNCIVGPAFCKSCGQCDNPCIEKENTNVQSQRNNNPRTESERLHLRERAIRMVERELKAAYLYESTGFPLHPDGEQRSDVPHEVSSKVVTIERKDKQKIGARLPRKFSQRKQRFATR